jgi:vesicle-associated membrane protein 7
VRIAVNFLRELADKFFERYPPAKLNVATDHSLNDFNGIIADRMKTFNNPSEVDKFAKLQRKMTEVEEMALKNLDKAIDRGIQISVLEQKTSDMNVASYDLKTTATKVRNHMWWKNKKIMVAIILLVLLLIFVIVWIVCGIAFQKCK